MSRRFTRAVQRAGFFVGVILFASGIALIANTLGVSSQTTGVEWDSGTCREFFGWPHLPSQESDFGEYLGKDVGAVSISGQGSNTLEVTVVSGYPSYGVQCDLTHIVTIATSKLTGLNIESLSGLHNCIVTNATMNRYACDELTVLYHAGSTSCVPQGAEIDDQVIFHVEQKAPEASLLSFQITLSFSDECDPGEEGPDEETSQPNELDTPGTFTNQVAQQQTQRTTEVEGATRLPETGSGGMLADTKGGIRVGAGVLLIIAGFGFAAISLAVRRSGGFSAPKS